MIQAVNDSRALANDLRPVLLRLARLLRRESHAFGVTGGQATLLSLIKERPGVAARELADREHVSAPRMSAQLDALESAGLIRRERAADRRRVGLFLQPEGRRVLQAVRRQRTAWLAAQLRRLSDDDRAAIEHAIEPLARLLEGGRDE
jgi:DNA-binding MarR family transcriptional regulator